MTDNRLWACPELVEVDGLQFFQFQRRGYAKHSFVSVKTSVRQEDVAVGIEAEKVAKSLHGNHRAGDGFLFRRHLLHKNFQGFPIFHTGKTVAQIAAVEVTVENFVIIIIL